MEASLEYGVSSSAHPSNNAAVVNAGTQEAARNVVEKPASLQRHVSQTQRAMMVAFQKDPGEEDQLLPGANDSERPTALLTHHQSKSMEGSMPEHKSSSFQHVLEVHPYLRFGGVCMLGLVVISYARDGGIFNFAQHPELAWKIALGKSGELLVALACIFLPVSRKAVRRRYYDVMMALVIAMCLALHVHAAVRSSLSNGMLRFLSPGLLISLLMLFTMFNSWLGFRPWRILLLATVAFGPAVVVPPILSTQSGTWDCLLAASQPTVFWARYATEMIVIACVVLANLLSGLASAAEAKKERSVRHRLIAQAATAQALLETAVPPPIARALLSGTPAHELTRSFPSATIAFICLTDFEHMVASLPPHELLHWLDDIYGTFDRLIDLYDETIMKIETVMGTYVVAALPGISADIADHTVMIAQFCADVLDLCATINGQHVNVQIGINCGRVTAGVIGRTRQFYRLFGDTMNVASRMMSTGVVNKIHASKPVARLLLAIGVELHGIQPIFRGSTFVKGKGELPTFWLQRHSAEQLPENAAVERTIRLELLAREQQKAMDLSGAAALHLLVKPPVERRGKSPRSLRNGPSSSTQQGPRIASDVLEQILTARRLERMPSAAEPHHSVPSTSPLAHPLPALSQIDGTEASLLSPAASPTLPLIAQFASGNASGRLGTRGAKLPYTTHGGSNESEGAAGDTMKGKAESDTDHPPTIALSLPVSTRPSGSSTQLRQALRQVHQVTAVNIAAAQNSGRNHATLPLGQPKRSESTAECIATVDAQQLSLTARERNLNSMAHAAIEDAPRDGTSSNNTAQVPGLQSDQNLQAAVRIKPRPLVIPNSARNEGILSSSSSGYDESARSVRIDAYIMHTQRTGNGRVAGSATATAESLAQRYVERVVVVPNTSEPSTGNLLSVVAETAAKFERARNAGLVRIIDTAEDGCRPPPKQVVKVTTCEAVGVSAPEQNVSSSTPTSSGLPLLPSASPEKSHVSAMARIWNNIKPSVLKDPTSRVVMKDADRHHRRPATQTAASTRKTKFEFTGKSAEQHGNEVRINVPNASEAQDSEAMAAAINERLFPVAAFQTLSPLQRMQAVQHLIETGNAQKLLDCHADEVTRMFTSSSTNGQMQRIATSYDLRPSNHSASLKPQGQRAQGTNQPQAWEFKPKMRTKSMRMKVEGEIDSVGEHGGPPSTALMQRRKSQGSMMPVTPTSIDDISSEHRPPPPRTATAARLKALVQHGQPVFGFAPGSAGLAETGNNKSHSNEISADPNHSSQSAAAGSLAQSPPLPEPRLDTPKLQTATIPRIPSVWKGELQMGSEEPEDRIEDSGHPPTGACCCNTLISVVWRCCARKSESGRVVPMPLPADGLESRITTSCESKSSWLPSFLVSYDLSFADSALEKRMQDILLQSVLSSSITISAIIGAACLLTCIPAFVAGVQLSKTSFLAQGAWLFFLGLLFSTGWIGLKLILGLDRARSALNIAAVVFIMAFANSLMFHVLALRNDIVSEGHPFLESENMLEVSIWYFLPLVVWSQIALFLRLRFLVSLAASTGLAVLSSIVLLVSAPPDSVAGTAYGLSLLFGSIIITSIGCFFREIGNRSYFASFVAATAAEADANQVLQNLLPAQVVKPIMAGQEVLSEVHEDCAILFADLAGFTRMASSMDPNRLMVVLNTIYSRFDDMVEARGLWKAETIGDAYIAVAGLFHSHDDVQTGRAVGSSAAKSGSMRARKLAQARTRLEAVFDLAAAMQQELAVFRREIKLEIHMRIGVHIGNVVTGIVGSHRPRFGVFGIPVLIAEEMESLAGTDSVLCSVVAQEAYLASLYSFLPQQLEADAVARLRALNDSRSMLPVDDSGNIVSRNDRMISDNETGTETKVAAFGYRVAAIEINP